MYRRHCCTSKKKKAVGFSTSQEAGISSRRCAFGRAAYGRRQRFRAMRTREEGLPVRKHLSLWVFVMLALLLVATATSLFLLSLDTCGYGPSLRYTLYGYCCCDVCGRTLGDDYRVGFYIQHTNAAAWRIYIYIRRIYMRANFAQYLPSNDQMSIVQTCSLTSLFINCCDHVGNGRT